MVVPRDTQLTADSLRAKLANTDYFLREVVSWTLQYTLHYYKLLIYLII
jgi:hypothetical protein